MKCRMFAVRSCGVVEWLKVSPVILFLTAMLWVEELPAVDYLPFCIASPQAAEGWVDQRVLPTASDGKKYVPAGSWVFVGESGAAELVQALDSIADTVTHLWISRTNSHADSSPYTATELKKVAAAVRKLRRLETLRMMGNLYAEVLDEIPQLPRLHSLSVFGHTIPIEALRKILSTGRLTALSMTFPGEGLAQYAALFEEYGVERIECQTQAKYTNLVLGCLSRAKGLKALKVRLESNEQLQYVAEYFELECLDISGSDNVNDRGIADLVKRMPGLVALDLSFITQVGFVALESLAKLKDLKELFWQGRIQRDDYETGGNMKWGGHRLGDLTKLPELKGLRRLSLAGHPTLGGGGLATMDHLRQLPDLEYLDMSGCANITDEDLEAVAAFTKLRQLAIGRVRAHELAEMSSDVVGKVVQESGLRKLAGSKSLLWVSLRRTDRITLGMVQVLQSMKLEGVDIAFSHIDLSAATLIAQAKDSGRFTVSGDNLAAFGDEAENAWRNGRIAVATPVRW